MHFFTTVRLAIAMLLANKGRAALTNLGIAIGVCAVVALVSAGEGARAKMDERLDSAGRNLIIIRPGGRTASGIIADFAPLAEEDAEAIRQQVGGRLVGITPWQVADRLATSRAGSHPTTVIGSWPDFQRVGNWQVVEGRLFGEREQREAASVCLLGQTILHKLFPTGAHPLGEKVQAGPLQLTVIGVLGIKGKTPLGVDQDDQIFVPLSTLQRKLAGKKDIVMLLATARTAADLDPARDQITAVLRRQHQLRPGVGNDFDVTSTRELSQFAVTMTAVMQVLVVCLATIALVVGGVGVMNIMLVSVTERTREIGLRMAVGATPASIFLQFLTEGVVLALGGGIAGILAGIVCALVLARLVDWPGIVSPTAIVLGFGLNAAVGVFFGWYPAWKAAQLDPIEALRHE